jgi:mRNA-degrading endonuclease YafQ of YafQ-DinJ toxin-antitoxin module
MAFRYRAVPKFWRNFKKLSPQQKESVRAAWSIFKSNPFDPRLRVHKIHRLSAAYGKTVHAVEVEADLRVIFTLDGETVVTLDVGSHSIYRS